MRHIATVKSTIKMIYVNQKRILFVSVSIIIITSMFLAFKFFLSSKPTCVKGNCYTGFGIMSFENETVYAGGFFEGKFHDYGVIKSQSESSYEGMWKLGKKHGSGKLIYPDGSVYTGNFQNDIKEGKGNYIWPDKTAIYSRFVNGEPEGLSRVVLPNGIQLEGIYRNGIIFDGKGIYIYDDGSRYIGEWEDGKRNGNGVLLNNTGVIIKSGIWKNDEFISP